MKRKGLLALVLILGLLSGCNKGGAKAIKVANEIPEVVMTSQRADQGAANFGMALLKQVRSEGSGTLLSPLSVLLALGMTAEGAVGETQTALLHTLAPGCTLEELRARCASLLADYTNLGGSTKVHIADSLWLDTAFQPEQSFVDHCGAAYQAQVFTGALNTSKTFDQVDAWVKEHTNGMIPNIMGELNPDTTLALLLVNALYLKNTWSESFSAQNTSQWIFQQEDGTECPMDFLGNGIRMESCFITERERGVVLPYDDGRLAFVAVHPENGDLTSYLATLNGETLAALVAGAETKNALVRLPKFEAEYSVDLAEDLAAMGLSKAFDPGQADFSAMGAAEGGPLYLGAVLHKVRIAVNEEGTEAAAATVVEVESGSAEPQSSEQFVFDRPFIYAVLDLERGIPLLLGTYEGG